MVGAFLFSRRSVSALKLIMRQVFYELFYELYNKLDNDLITKSTS